MTTIKTIAAQCMEGLDIRQGDTLRILASHGNAFVVEISRDTAGESDSEAISQWLRSARGTIRLQPGESVDDARMQYYSKKYGLDR